MRMHPAMNAPVAEMIVVAIAVVIVVVTEEDFVVKMPAERRFVTT